MFEQFVTYLETLAQVIPLTIFSFVGSFIEEVVAPIPSPFVMTGAGSIASSQHQVVVYLLLLAVIGAAGKTLGGLLIYWVADKGEDIVLTKFGKFIGVSHKEVETIGKYLNHGWRDDIVLFIIRALPILPSGPVSAVCGLIKLNLRTFITATFLGSIVRNLFFLYIGYEGLSILSSGFDQAENIGKIIFLVVALAGLVFVIYKRRSIRGE